MQYKTKWCPNCKLTIERRKPQVGNKYGSPLQRCPRCGNYYIDDDYEEYALSTDKEGIRTTIVNARIGLIVLRAFFIFLGILTIVGLMMSEIDVRKTSTLIVLGIIALCISAFFNAPTQERIKNDLEKMNDIWEESNSRLSNQQYAILLEKTGFDVPLRYLPEDMQKEKIERKEAAKDPYDYYLYKKRNQKRHHPKGWPKRMQLQVELR